MWLVLCDPDDVSALWAGQGLRARGVTPVEFVSPAELVCARRLEYRAERNAPACASADLTGGRRIDVRRLRGTLNRATRVEYPQVRCAAAADRTYVHAEMDAVLLAWLGALTSPVYNPAQPSGWSGPLLHPFAWALRAQTAGFATMPHRCGYSGLEIPFTQSRHITSHLVFGGYTFPRLPEAMERAAVRLSASTGIPLLGVALAWMPDGQATFDSATPTPDLRTGGTAFLDALATAFSTA